MKIQKLIVALFIFGCVNSSVGFAQKTSVNPSKIGWVTEGMSSDELKAIQAFLANQEKLETVEINAIPLLEERLATGDLTHLWIHRLDTDRAPFKSQKTIDAIKKFVKNGGNLVLSMEAVNLLNDWGIEKNLLETKVDTITDNGFGRPLGFHAFKSHPIFDGMNGGAYPWKSKEDHLVRKIGFFDENLPNNAAAKIVGIEWTYITFHENNKLILEYPLGKGKIMAIGAFSYFAKENYNTEELHRLYLNIFTYMSGENKGVSNYWQYTPQKVTALDKTFKAQNLALATKWELPELTLSLKKQEATKDATLMTGRRMVIGGSEKGGIEEIWTNPFMSFRDINTGVVLKGEDTVVWLNELTPVITSSPELIIREYTISGASLKEITTVSMDKPVGVVHYEWDNDKLAKIMMTYTTNLRYMWPYSEKVTATISYKWASEMNAVVNVGQYGELASLMGFSAKPESFLLGQYDDFAFENGEFKATKTDLIQVSGVFTFDAKKANGKLNAYMVAGDNGLSNTVAMYNSEAKNFNQLYLKSSDYYRNLLDSSLMLTTPDTDFNTGYQWAMIRTDQFFQETPAIGTSMVAGLGTTSRGWDGGQKVNGRPGYSWYFGRDAQWTGFAVNAYGGHKMVKKILEVFVTYQSLNGKILHELTTSGAVHYDASDSTPLFVVLAAHYLKYSGDLEYINEIWPALKKAMDFCYSTDTDNDGLIEITNVGHGWVEGGSLFGTHTEVYLAGSWAAALDAASYISSSLNKKEQSISYSEDAQKVKNIIDTDFWNSDENYFYNGKMIDGSYMNAETVLAGVPVYFNAVVDPMKAFKTAASFAGNMFTTDWGVRIIPESSKKFHPQSYHGGMVWPLFAGWASLAEYKTGNYTSAYSHVMNNLLMYKQWNMGSVEETLDGSKFEPAGVSSQQGWSETMVLQPVSEGMLGIVPDALSNNISLSPQFPWNWNTVKVANINFGTHSIDFEMNRTQKTTTFHFKGDEKQEVTLNFSTSLPLGTKVKKVAINNTVVPFTVVEKSESIALKFDPILLKGASLIEIYHNKGIGALPQVNEPQPGDTNKEAKIIKQQLSDEIFDLVIEGLPGKKYQVRVMSNSKIKKVYNARIIKKEGTVYTLETETPASSQKYATQKISIKVKH